MQSTRSERRSESAGNPDDPGSPIQTVFYACGPSGYVGRTAAIGLCGLLVLLLTALTVSAGTASAVVPRPLASPAGALLVTFDIQVDAGASDYVHRAAQAASASKQDLVIAMNTPGGLLSNMAQNNTAFSGTEAAAIGLVTGMAQSLGDFLTKVGLNGVPVTPFEEPLYDRFLSFLSDPTVDGLFILIGIIALVLDLFHRTLFLSVVAVIFIALGFLGAQVIGASVVGILILIIAAALVILEVKAGHGLFAITGIVLGLAGTYLLAYNVEYSPSPYGVTQYVILGGTGGALVVAFLYLTRIRKALMAQPKLIDPTRIVNMTGRAATDLVPGKDGVANVGAEDWTAQSDQFIAKGTLIRVTGYGDGKIQVTISTPEGPEPPKSNDPSAAPPSSP